MSNKLKISHTKNLTRAKVRNSLNFAFIDTLVRFGLIESVYDKNLYIEDIEVIKLHYEKYSKWIILHNTSFLAFLTLTFIFGNTFFIIMMIISLIQVINTNIKFNLSFNILLQKHKSEKLTK